MTKQNKAVMGEGKAPRLLTWPYGDWCVYCGKDSWTCEHFEPPLWDDAAEREAEYNRSQFGQPR